MSTTKHRITASLIVLTLLAIDGICIWALLQPGMVPMTWLWFGHLFFAVYFCAMTVAFCMSHDGLTFILRGKEE